MIIFVCLIAHKMTDEINNGQANYSAQNIQVLEGLEAVRKRPAMYIGDISEKGLHHLVYEVVDNSIDESMAGYCTHIEVAINQDGSITVQDNGRGIPVDMHPKEHKSALEVVMTVLHAGGKFDKGSYKVSGGLHGVGVSCVNALSTKMITEVFRDGKVYRQEYACGKPVTAVECVGTTDINGTRQTFWPDGSIFTTTEYKYDILAARLHELAFLNAGLKISLTDYRVMEEGEPKKDVFFSNEGLKEFVSYIDENRVHLIQEPIYLNTEKQNVPIEIAIMYNTGYSENLHSYVNNINTNGFAVSEKSMIGTWKMSSTDEVNQFILRKDHTYSYVSIVTSPANLNFSQGKLKYIYKETGIWELKGDSLIAILDSVDFEELISETEIKHIVRTANSIYTFIEYKKER